MTDVLYKWLNDDNTTGYQRKPWPVDYAQWTPTEVPVICRSGWHACYEKDVLNHCPGPGASLYEVEVRGKVVEGDDKISAESMRIKWYIGTATEQNLRLFAADCAEDVLPIFYKVSPNDHRPAEAIRVARLYANGEASDEQRRTARDAAGAAARDAARAAARAAPGRSQGRSQGRSLGRSRGRSLGAAGAAAWAAAWDRGRGRSRGRSPGRSPGQVLALAHRSS